MKKVKGLFAVMLILCMITSTVSFPVVASDNGADITSWKSSDYLDPDNPVTEGNPWSLESTNNASNSYEVFDGTEMKETEQALFPVMPDGNSPETAYIVNGAANWGNQGYNMAVNGKYMIPASIYSGTSGDDIKSASGKMAKVFTAPKDGTLIITAGETNGEDTKGNIATMTLAANSWDAPRQNWNIIKDGEVLATANGASRVSAGSYDLVAIDDVTVDVAEGDKIYFEFVPSAWTLRESQACMWDPVVEYYVEEVTYWNSSDYFNPDEPVTDSNPWTLESTNNSSNSYEVFDGTEMVETGMPLFPEMPDGESPTTAYIRNGEPNWGNQGYNMAVNGKYMIPACIYTGTSGDAVKTASGKMAKVFTAPKAGTLKITSGATNGDGTEGKIATMTLAANSWDAPRQNWNIIKNDEVLATANGASRVSEGSYDLIEIDDVIVEVEEGDKIYFEFVPSAWTLRASQAFMWEPIVEYTTDEDIGGGEGGGETDEEEEGEIVDDTTTFLSSKYLNPEVPYINNPWTAAFETEDGSWLRVKETTETVTDPAFDLFPQMPDGETPTTGYIYSGTFNRNYDAAKDGIWKDNGYNMAVNGKYMVAASFWNGSAYVAARAKVAKIFTAPKDGRVRIGAAATIDEDTEGMIIPTKLAASWDDAKTSWSVEIDGEVIWSKIGDERLVGNDYDSVVFDKQYVDVEEGDKIYFVFQPTQQSSRATQACMWDPVVKYTTKEEEDAEAGLPVDDTITFKSSKYLDPEIPYVDNPWMVETTNNYDAAWEQITNTTPSSATFELFPVMSDGVQPTKAYVHTGDYRNAPWASQGVNIAVNGKYMIGGGAWTGEGQTAGAKIAKTFTAPTDGWVKITTAETIDEESIGRIIPNRISNSQYSDAMQAWMVEKNDSVIWSADGRKREMGIKYDYIEFGEINLLVHEGDKLRFVFQPRKYGEPRSEQACIWDPVVEYTSFDIEEDVPGDDDIETDPNSYLSSYYLDPEKPRENSPWTVETTNNNDEKWKQITNTTPNDRVSFPIFPIMPDGNQPVKAYVQTGEDCSNYWMKQGYEIAVSGKYMIPAAGWHDDPNAAAAKVAKVFTAPKDGMIKITAEAVMGEDSDGLLITRKVTEDWVNEGMAWIVEKGGTQIWKRDGTQRVEEDEYDTIRFDPMFVEVKKGEKLYFILQPRAYGERAAQATIWDPRIAYIGDPIVLSDDSKDKPDYVYPVDHKFELTLSSAPIDKITAENFVISDKNVKVKNIFCEENILMFEIEGLSYKTKYNFAIKDIAYALVDDEYYTSDISFNFSTADALSLISALHSDGELKTGDNTLKATVVCSDANKISKGDSVIVIASVINSDNSVSSVKVSEVKLTDRITSVECNVNIGEGQWIRAWIADSLDNIKPIGGKMTDITQ